MALAGRELTSIFETAMKGDVRAQCISKEATGNLSACFGLALVNPPADTPPAVGHTFSGPGLS